MPGAPNKIIINNIHMEGEIASMQAAYNVSEHIGEQIEWHDPEFGEGKVKGLMKEAHQLFTPRLEANCKLRTEYMEAITATQNQINEEMEEWLNDKLGLTQP